MQLSNIEQIDDRLEIIKQLIVPEDAYYINDVIITNITDPEMPDLVREMLDLNGYSEEEMHDVLEKVIEIQHLAHDEDVEEATEL